MDPVALDTETIGVAAALGIACKSERFQVNNMSKISSNEPLHLKVSLLVRKLEL